MGRSHIYGYARISTSKDTQKTDRQIVALQDYAKENGFAFDSIIEERISGTVKTDNRPAYNELKRNLREDDILVLTDVDRLGRDARNVIQELSELRERGIKVVAMDIPYLNEWNKVQNDSIYEMMIDILITLKAHMAQQDREKIVNRINQGIAAAKTKGVKLGRPKVVLPDGFIKEYKKYKEGKYGNMTACGFAKMMGIGRATLYKYIKIFDGQNKI